MIVSIVHNNKKPPPIVASTSIGTPVTPASSLISSSPRTKAKNVNAIE